MQSTTPPTGSRCPGTPPTRSPLKASPRCRCRVTPPSGPRLALGVDHHGVSRGSGRLDAVFLAAEVVGDIPVVGIALAGRARAALDIVDLARAVVAADVRSDGRPGDCAADRGDVVAAPAADLVAENAADQSADDRAGH